jgi:hypothetical protein
MSAPNTEIHTNIVEPKHQQAVARTLRWADEAAERGDHFEALSWLSTLEAVGHPTLGRV